MNASSSVMFHEPPLPASDSEASGPNVVEFACMTSIVSSMVAGTVPLDPTNSSALSMIAPKPTLQLVKRPKTRVTVPTPEEKAQMSRSQRHRQRRKLNQQAARDDGKELSPRWKARNTETSYEHKLRVHLKHGVGSPDAFRVEIPDSQASEHLQCSSNNSALESFQALHERNTASFSSERVPSHGPLVYTRMGAPSNEFPLLVQWKLLFSEVKTNYTRQLWQRAQVAPLIQHSSPHQYDARGTTIIRAPIWRRHRDQPQLTPEFHQAAASGVWGGKNGGHWLGMYVLRDVVADIRRRLDAVTDLIKIAFPHVWECLELFYRWRRLKWPEFYEAVDELGLDLGVLATTFTLETGNSTSLQVDWTASKKIPAFVFSVEDPEFGSPNLVVPQLDTPTTQGSFPLSSASVTAFLDGSLRHKIAKPAGSTTSSPNLGMVFTCWIERTLLPTWINSNGLMMKEDPWNIDFAMRKDQLDHAVVALV